MALDWLYKATEKYYGSEGQESIDPAVFFKICLIGYINNITSDRKLIEFCSDSLGIRLRFTAPKTAIKAMALLQAKTREGLVCIKTLFTATYCKADNDIKNFQSIILFCRNIKQTLRNSF
jgi:hypothetical protein